MECLAENGVERRDIPISESYAARDNSGDFLTDLRFRETFQIPFKIHETYQNGGHLEHVFPKKNTSSARAYARADLHFAFSIPFSEARGALEKRKN